MNDDELEEPIQSKPWKFGIEVLRFDYLTVFMWGRFRFLWYDPRDRENWKFDPIFNEGTWQVGIGPAVVAYIRSEA